ncbi:ATP-binding protein [Arthrobacter sp. NEB 688]|uniref:ATP-binding protein n=1 Tax=Arthrobacter sp. NEB 688 TaxID=904039 RepID=UPI001564680A|nr:ATP-binding protein [Arthrobacter sp. NEB 688]QKE82951.1 ATP-dependent DNA helicase RecG [Arthrobacter sp. NEB 688]
MIRDLGVVDVDADAVARVLALQESHFLDLKAIEITPVKLGVHVTAFGNAAGGELYVGVDEIDAGQRKWRGFSSVEDANGHVQVLHDLFQGDDTLGIQFLRGPGVPGFVMHLVVEKSRQILTTTDGSIYIRVSAQRLPVKVNSHEEVERLRLDKGLATYEDMPIKDLPIETVSDSLTVTTFVVEAVPVSEAEPWLRSQRLIIDGSPTVAAVLLFADEPQVVLPKRSAIKILRYKSAKAEGHRDQMDGDPITIEGSLTDLIRKAVAKVIEIVEGHTVQTPSGLQPVAYPPETLHEIVTNAVLHRDYSIATDIQIRIFDNRIEVDSPGKFPGHVTESNFLDEQFARNGKVVRLINKFPDPPNKDVGEGLNTAFQKMREIGLKPPQLVEEGNKIVAYIRHERLASYEEQIIEYLQNNDEINNSKARELTGEGSENKMKRTFEKMMEAQQIHRDPSRKGSATTYLLGPPAKTDS